MPKSATRGAKSASWAAAKLERKVFAFAGAIQCEEPKRAAGHVIAEGGRVVEDVTAEVDYLVAGPSPSGKPTAAEKKAQQLNQKQGAAIQVIDEDAFHDLFSPTPEEALAMLTGGEKGLARWRQLAEHALFWRTYTAVAIQGADLSGRRLRGVDLSHAGLDGVDFRNADLGGARIQGAVNCTFDGARMVEAAVWGCKGCSFRDADLRKGKVGPLEGCTLDGARITQGNFSGEIKDCSARKIDLGDTRLDPADLSGSNFTGAKMPRVDGGHTAARDAVFRDADLTEARLEESHFERSDFTGADLGKARLHKGDFTGATLVRARLAQADLRHAKLVKTDLGKANLRETNLADADLTGTTIDGADFAGANLTGATLTGLDLSRAKNLDPKQVSAGVGIGPRMKELAKVAGSSRKLETSAELDLGGERVTVTVTWRHYAHAAYAGAGYMHERPGITSHAGVDAPTLEQGMLNLARQWFRGKLNLDSITATAEKCPLRGPALRELASAAWCEAFGLEAPSAEAFSTRQQAQKAGKETLREQLLAELRGGTKGVKKWNKRKREEREKAGKFRRLDLAGLDLAAIDLSSLDFEEANLEGADLKGAQLVKCGLKGASFKKADLAGANLALARASGANFEEAKLVECNLRGANFRQSGFRNANLHKAGFDFSDLSGADFTGARLKGVVFYQTKFDGQTRWPADFALPDGLVWRGAGPDPRTVPQTAPAAQAGPIDFEAFLKRLEGHTEAARLSKALQMLKAERFQLFADVQKDHLVGVVKSQSSASRVYSCRLASDGSFACCTQNLLPCGGLRGAPCKHLLVLIVGLAKGGQADPAALDAWVQASRSKGPALDKGQMSETFLRYKGAEAGEVDWRPTETIPEDYYAL